MVSVAAHVRPPSVERQPSTVFATLARYAIASSTTAPSSASPSATLPAEVYSPFAVNRFSTVGVLKVAPWLVEIATAGQPSPWKP